MRDQRVVLTAAALLVLAVGAAAPAAGQVDFSGTWRLSIEATQPPIPAATAIAPKLPVPCVYSGTVLLTQSGDQVSGPAELFLVSGVASCPAEMSGALTGVISSDMMGGFVIEGMIDGSSPSGVTSFSGSISPNPGGSGSFVVTQGDFTDVSGTWSAILQLSVLQIPNLGPFGLALLTLLLLGAGAWILSRQAA